MIFSVGYIGQFFRQKWAYWAVALVACSWMMQFIISGNYAGPEDYLISRNIIIHYGIIVILSVICALTCRLHRK